MSTHGLEDLVRTEILMKMAVAIRSEAKSISKVARWNMDSVVAASVRRLAVQPVFQEVVEYLQRDEMAAMERAQYDAFLGPGALQVPQAEGAGVIVWNFDDEDDEEENQRDTVDFSETEHASEDCDGEGYTDVFLDTNDGNADSGAASQVRALGEELVALSLNDTAKTEDKLRALHAVAGINLVDLMCDGDWSFVVSGLGSAISDSDLDVGAASLMLCKARSLMHISRTHMHMRCSYSKENGPFLTRTLPIWTLERKI
jgi:hypothetical protein